MGQWCPVGATPVRLLSSPPSHLPTSCGDWRGEGRHLPGRVRSTPPILSNSFPPSAVKMSMSGVERHQHHGKLWSLPAQWQEAFHTVHAHDAKRDASALGVSAIPTANGLLKIDDWQLKAIAMLHHAVPHFTVRLSSLERPSLARLDPWTPPSNRVRLHRQGRSDHARCRSVRKKERSKAWRKCAK